MRVIQCVHSYDACDLHTIIYHDHALKKSYGLRIYAIMLPSSGFSVAHCKMEGLPSNVEINVIVDEYQQVASPEGLASSQGGLSKGVPLYASLWSSSLHSRLTNE